jgi:hypothetical protein
MSLDTELLTAMWAYCDAQGIESMVEGIRNMLRTGLASSPMSGAVDAARRRAYSETRVWVMDRTAEFFRDMSTQMSRERPPEEQ